MTPTTWEEASGEAASDILLFRGTYPNPLDFIDARLTDMNQPTPPADSYPPAHTAAHDRGCFVMIAHCALQQYDAENPGRAMAKILETIADKQADYGPQNILWAGVPGIVLRMHDKTARLRNLYARYWKATSPAEEKASVEPLADSWLDLVGYSIVGIMLLDGTFELPLQRDLPVPIQCDPSRYSGLTVQGNTGNQPTPDPFSQAEADPEIKEAFRLFNAASHAPEGVTPTGTDDEYTIEGGGTINVYTAPDGSHTHVTFTDGEGGVLDIMAAAGYVGIDTDDTVFDLRGQRMAVILSMLLGAAESGLGWRNTKVSAEVPRDEQ